VTEKPTKRKPTKRKPTKRKLVKRKPRKVTRPVATSVTLSVVSSVRVTHAEMRRHAAVDYITDPDGRSVDFHWGRDDREYCDHVKVDTFRQWARLDQWTDRREQFWEEIELRTLDGLQDRILRARLDELKHMTEARSYMAEYMLPVKHPETGQVMRHPAFTNKGEVHPCANLPIYALDLPRFDRFIKSLLDLDERVMLKRGEAITRTETVGRSTKITTTALDPVGSLMNITPEEARRLAKNLLRQRMGERYHGVLDVPAEEGTDDNDIEKL